MTSTLFNVRMTVTLLTLLLLTIPFNSIAESITGEKPMNRKKVFIVHGYMAKPSDHWFKWLKAELTKKSINTEILELPDSDSPDARAWQETLTKKIDRLDEQTYIVAHSLGCIAVLKYLHNNESRLGGLFFVSGFNTKLPALPQLDPFINDTKVTGELAFNTALAVVFASTNDSLVPMLMTQALSESLDAKYIQVEKAGHFLSKDGYSEFPQLLQEILLSVDG